MMKIDNLRCEFLTNPHGIDVLVPRLSWQLCDERQGARQMAYQIRAGSWDSGRVESAQSHLVPYAGPPLSAGQEVRWRVRVWGHEGQPSEWSAPAFWSMGLLQPTDWAPAVWIGLDRPDPTSPADEYRRLPARYLRREFAPAGLVRRATVTLCGLGVFDLHINGALFDENLVLNPSQTDFERRVLYHTFDVTPRLQPGTNTVGVVLGNGRFHALRPGGHRDFGFPKLIFHLAIEYADGRREVVVSDGRWRVTDQGPVRANHEYDGETYDARREMPGWDATGFDDSAWLPAELAGAPGGQLEAHLLEPTRVVGVLVPVAVRRHSNGAWLVDFGQTTYGQPRLRVRGPAGTEIRVVGAYSLRRDGTLKTDDNRGARCTDVFILKGEGDEVLAPRFRAQGCRWLQITGWPGELKSDAIELLVVAQDMEPAGEFACSDPLLNEIHASVGRGVRAFLRQGLPWEPDRDERQPWLGDPARNALSYAAHRQVAPFLRKWLADIRLAQLADGSIPAIAPKYWTFGGEPDAVWPAVITILPEWLYRHYGDRCAVEENYPAACRWVAHLERGLRNDDTTDDAVYGDWCDTASMDGKGTDHGATSRPLIASAYLIHSAQLLERMAGILNLPAEAAGWRAKATRWTGAFNRRFFDSSTGLYESATQCALLLPLAFGLVPAAHRDRVIANLVGDILETNRGHTTVGLIGNQWLLTTLSAVGRPDVAHTIATRTDRPSWGYMVAKGATTIWERWDADTRDPGMNSEALLIQAGVLSGWLIETLAGISPDPAGPGFSRVQLSPAPVPGLAGAGADVRTPYGTVKSHWKFTGDDWVWDVTVPPNSRALARLPVNQGQREYDLGAGTFRFAVPQSTVQRE